MHILLSGCVDLFLQDGMQKIDSFLKHTKDTLKVIEEFNEKIDARQLNLDGVAVFSLDIVSMYTSMSEEHATNTCKDYFSSRTYQMDGNDNFDSTNSMLSALDLRLKNHIFQFNNKIYKQINVLGT